jgi:hypothetical protein
MNKRPFKRAVVIAAVAAAAIALAVSGASAAGEKKGAKMAEKPAGPGLCTAHVNNVHWGWMNYRTAGGNLLPTAMWCPEASCPAKC